MNPWLSFIKDFYASERRRDNTRCRYSGNLKRVAKIYNCKKRMSTRKVVRKEKFSQVNPMSKTRRARPFTLTSKSA